TEDFDLSDYKDQINFQYIVKLGSKVKCNEKATNASKISKDGKELTWDLELGKKNEVIYEFEIPSSGGVIAIGVCVVLLIALGGIGVFLLKKTGKQDNLKTKEEVAK
ncbi:MAG: hypothetical protein K2M17_04070, partial [Bacilli bacterium]|nr:hypothetical protein [Bacilli bacterium]